MRLVVPAVLLLAAVGCTEPAPAPGSAPQEQATELPPVDREPAPSPHSEEPEASAAPSEREVTIAASGDVLFHLKVLESGRRHGLDHLFSGLARSLSDEEIAVANLESPLADDIVDMETGTPPVTGAPPEAAGALARAGLDVLACGNNHAYDQQSEGLRRTLVALREAGLSAVGCGETPEAAGAAAEVRRGAVAVAFLGATARINGGPSQSPPRAHIARIDEEALARAAASARERADAVVLLVHWSGDFRDRVMDSQRELARSLVEAGVDVIVGTGPHVLQEVEILPSPRGQAVVAYSLGNLLSNQGLRWRPGMPPRRDAMRPMFDPGSRDAVVLKIRLDLENGVRVTSLAAVPLWTANNFLVAHDGPEELDIHLVRHDELDAVLRADRAQAIRAALGPRVDLL